MTASNDTAPAVSSNPAEWAGYEPPDGWLLGWKVVRPDGRTHGDFQWPLVEAKVVADPDGREFSRDAACPQFEGDGLCIAKTWRGAASGCLPAVTGLAVAYRTQDVLGEDENKLRVSGCRVVGVLDLQRLLREGKGRGADLYGADLRGADLYGADLYGANLRGADLRGADLYAADLYGADLRRANLRAADLYGADLRGADLRGADLYGANLRAADLRGADLYGANLRRADLRAADLYGANLRRADLYGAVGITEASS